MQLKQKIQSLEINAVALRKVADETAQELEDIKRQMNQPAPALRHNLKKVRIIDFEAQYLKGKWNKK